MLNTGYGYFETILGKVLELLNMHTVLGCRFLAKCLKTPREPTSMQVVIRETTDPLIKFNFVLSEYHATFKIYRSITHDNGFTHQACSGSDLTPEAPDWAGGKPEMEQWERSWNLSGGQWNW